MPPEAVAVLALALALCALAHAALGVTCPAPPRVRFGELTAACAGVCDELFPALACSLAQPDPGIRFDCLDIPGRRACRNAGAAMSSTGSGSADGGSGCTHRYMCYNLNASTLVFQCSDSANDAFVLRYNDSVVIFPSTIDRVTDMAVPKGTNQLVLDARGSAIANVSRRFVASWAPLHRLEVYSAPLPSPDASALPSMPALVSLVLSNALLATWPSSMAQRVPRLTSLVLPRNQLSALPSTSLPPFLTVLDVSYNPLAAALATVALPSSLVFLDLSGCGLTTAPSALHNASLLQTLKLNDNAIAALPESSLPTTLRHIELRRTGLTTLPPDLAHMKNLTVLDLSGNALDATALPDIDTSALESLRLSNCALSALPPLLSSTAFPSLHFLDLSWNPLDDAAAASAVQLLTPHANLSLDLSYTKLEHVPGGLVNWTNNTASASLWFDGNALQELSLTQLPTAMASLSASNCSLRTLAPTVRPNQTIEAMNFSHNKLNAFPPEFSPAVQGLITLDLDGNVGIHLSRLPSDLQQLSLVNCSLASLPFLRSLSSLKVLTLANNNLSTFPTAVFNLTNLVKLDIGGNPLSNVSVTLEQFQFLTNLQSFRFDVGMFRDPTHCPRNMLLRAVQRVCITDPVADIAASSTSAQADVSTTMSEARSTAMMVLWIVILVAVVLLATLTLTVLYWRQFSRDPQSPQGGIQDQDRRGYHDKLANYAAASHRSEMPLTTRLLGPGNDVQLFDDEAWTAQWRLDTAALHEIAVIGSGVFCIVWLANLLDECVVIKKLPRDLQRNTAAVNQFLKEVKLMSEFEHPTIVQFLGVAWTSEVDVRAVVEYMARGDLRSYLEDSDAPGDRWTSNRPGTSLRIALDVAEALAYMHGLTLALSHRDLKSRHILLNDQFTAKLSDLGHARNRPRTDLMAGPVFGSGRWMAPELLTSTARGRRTSSASNISAVGASVDGAAADVYSFGVLLVELDSHDLPYAHVLEDNPDMTETTLHRMIVDRQVKPEIDAATTSCPLRIQQLVMQCTTYEPEDRPSMADVVVQLREIARSQLLTRLDTIESAILQSQSQRSLQFFAYDSDTEEKQSEGRRSF